VHLDVRLHVLLTSLRSIESIDVDSMLRQHVDEAIALLVDETSQDLRVDRSHERGRAEQRTREASAFFVGPVDERHGDGRLAFGREGAQQFESGHDAERSVEPTALRNTVEVAAHHEGVVAFAPQVGPQVAGFVDFDVDRKSGQVLAQKIARLDPFGCPGQATRARRATGARGQALEIGDDTPRIERRHGGIGCHGSTVPCAR
jgi:hypothetical protein